MPFIGVQAFEDISLASAQSAELTWVASVVTIEVIIVDIDKPVFAGECATLVELRVGLDVSIYEWTFSVAWRVH